MACADGVSVPFPKNKAELDLDAVGKVLLTVSTLEACPSASATVTGHAGRDEPDTLAGTRAGNVAAVLNKNGIEASRIRIALADGTGGAAAKPDNRSVSVSWR
jgi:outer membrane protein OmpA-like peptidoglycan-associated protein